MGNWSTWFLVLVFMFAFSAVGPELFVMVIYDVNWGFKKKKNPYKLMSIQYLPVISWFSEPQYETLLGLFHDCSCDLIKIKFCKTLLGFLATSVVQDSKKESKTVDTTSFIYSFLLNGRFHTQFTHHDLRSEVTGVTSPCGT